MARLKTGPKIILIILLVVGFVFGLRKAAELGWIPTPGVMQALVPEKALLPDVKDALLQNVEPAPLPTSSPAGVRARQDRSGLARRRWCDRIRVARCSRRHSDREAG